MRSSSLLVLVTATAAAEPADLPVCTTTVCEVPTGHRMIGGGPFISHSVVADADHVYWSNAGTHVGSVYAAAKTGGAPVLLAETESFCRLAVDDRFVYISVARSSIWRPSGAYASGRLLAVAKTGGPSVVLADGIAYPDEIAVDDSHVYFTFDGGVARVRKSGGHVETIATGNSGFLALDDHFVYVTDQGPRSQRAGDGGPGRDMKRGQVLRIAKSGGRATVLATGLSEPTGIAVDATSVYVTAYSEYAPGRGAVIRVGKAGGVSMLADHRTAPSALRIDSGRLFWIERGPTQSARALVALDVAAGKPLVLDANLHAATDLAVDQSAIYYSSIADSDGWESNMDGSRDVGAVVRRPR